MWQFAFLQETHQSSCSQCWFCATSPAGVWSGELEWVGNLTWRVGGWLSLQTSHVHQPPLTCQTHRLHLQPLPKILPLFIDILIHDRATILNCNSERFVWIHVGEFLEDAKLNSETFLQKFHLKSKICNLKNFWECCPLLFSTNISDSQP